MSGTWPTGWAPGDIVTAPEFAKGVGAIYDTKLTVAAANIDITGIIAGYAHLAIEFQGRGAGACTYLQMRFNNDSGANYQHEFNLDTAGTYSGDGGAADSSIFLSTLTRSTDTAGRATSVRIAIPNYAGTTFDKQAVATSYGTMNAQRRATAGGGEWGNTAAINRITLFADVGNLDVGTRVTVYAMGA